MILVIHDNMINETNNIVLHVFVAFLIPMMQKYHMLKWEDSVYFEGLNREKKENKIKDNVGWTDGTKNASVGAMAWVIGTLSEDWS
jgi:hypothetical protein